MAAANDAEPVPAGTRLRLAAGARWAGASWLTGGAPWRLLRLSPAGGRLVGAWAAGAPVGDEPQGRHLAGRLVDAGLLVADPDPGADLADVTFVVPVRDRAAGLARTLDALDPSVPVVVVDDGSVDPGPVAALVAARPGATCLRRDTPGGPGAARNTGWRDASSELVAFVDADCAPAPAAPGGPPSWTGRLSGHFADPAVGAVAPRVRSDATGDGPHWLTAYERARSPLDLGPAAAPVRPRSTVAYVPTAALVVRRAAIEGLGGFDEAMATGEDVDLVWRLHAAGWRVRYDPSVEVSHPPRATLRAWATQRFGYGRSAAPLAARHGTAVAPLTVSPWSAAAWTVAGLGHPAAGAALAAGSVAALAARHRSRGRPTAALVRAGAAGQWRAGAALAGAVVRAWWPVAAVAAAVSARARRAVLVAALAPAVVSWVRARPAVGPVTWIALRLADDAAYGAGVWAGAWGARSARCLVPAR